jgi:hypothetical protein
MMLRNTRKTTLKRTRSPKEKGLSKKKKGARKKRRKNLEVDQLLLDRASFSRWPALAGVQTGFSWFGVF